MSKSIEGFPVRPADPKLWWRKVCWATPFIAVSGDLPWNRTEALAQLRYWDSEGITDVFDMRGEANDTDFIHAHSTIKSHWFGVDDNGTTRSDAWFEALTLRAGEVLRDPNRKALVHCHMGCNRGPSAAYAIMINEGHDHLEALRLIRQSRPIASVMYAPDAIAWQQRSLGYPIEIVVQRRNEVVKWLDDNYLDIAWVIHNIGNRLAS